MNDEHDVLSQLVDYHDHISAPLVPLADDLRRGRGRVRRNRGLLAAGAALGVVSMIAAVTLSDGGHSADVPEPAHSPGLTTPLVAPQSPLDVSELGFHIKSGPDLVGTDYWAINRDRQEVGVQVLGGDSNAMELDVEVYYEGRPLKLPRTGTREPVTVNGVPGTYIEVGGQIVKPGRFHSAILAWEYAPGSWAAVSSGWIESVLPSDLRSKMLTAAEAVRPGGEALRVPVRVGTMPASLPSLKTARYVWLSGWGGDWQWWLSLDDAIQIHATAGTGSVVCEASDGSYHKASFTYRGHSGCLVDGEQIGLSLDDAHVFIDFVDAEPKPPIDDLKQVLADLTVASEDPTTWFDLRTALGG
jgi:hypothetical protein